MIKVKKMFIVLCGVFLMGNISQASMLDQLVYNIAGQAANAVGARLGDEIYYGSSKKKTRKHRHRKTHHKKKHVSAKRNYVPVMTDEKRIQKALISLGFYNGKVDGEVNSFETRSAIKRMNVAYGISNSASLKSEVKDTLIFLGRLFRFDRYLIAKSKNSREKDKKIQVALKLHGYYQGNIDGAIGNKTKGSIAQYKRDNGMADTQTLDFEEEYQMISSAKVKNDKNIEESIASLEAIGARQQRQVPQQNQPQYVRTQQTNTQYMRPQQSQGQYAQPQQNQQRQQTQVNYNQPQQNQRQQVQQPQSQYIQPQQSNPSLVQPKQDKKVVKTPASTEESFQENISEVSIAKPNL